MTVIADKCDLLRENRPLAKKIEKRPLAPRSRMGLELKSDTKAKR